MSATEWPGFHKFSRGPSLTTFFSGSPPVVGLANFRLDYIELPWFSLKIKNLILKIDSWVCWARDVLVSFTIACNDRELKCRVLRLRVMILSFMPASYVVEFYDHVLWYWVLCPRAVSSSFTTACCDIEFMPSSYVVEFYDRVLWYWVLWPRAMLSSQFI